MNPINGAKKPMISIEQIQDILALRETKDSLKKRLALIENALQRVEEETIHLLDMGANPNGQGFILAVKVTEKRYPAWKEELISRCGKETADKILNSTEPKIYRDLIVKEVA